MGATHQYGPCAVVLPHPSHFLTQFGCRISLQPPAASSESNVNAQPALEARITTLTLSASYKRSSSATDSEEGSGGGGGMAGGNIASQRADGRASADAGMSSTAASAPAAESARGSPPPAEAPSKPKQATGVVTLAISLAGLEGVARQASPALGLAARGGAAAPGGGAVDAAAAAPPQPGLADAAAESGALVAAARCAGVAVTATFGRGRR
jgi:hypothetical protein